MKNLIIAMALLFFASFGLVAQEYAVQSDNSQIKWLGEKVTGEHTGTIAIKDGSLAVDGDKLSGKFTIDMSSITVLDIPADNENNAKLTGHLKSDDFFGVEKHPEATFEIIKTSPMKVKEGQKANYRITGKLTIKGKTNEISFPAHVTMDDSKVMAKARVTVDRSKFDVRYGSGSFFDNLGDKLIYDDFHLDLAIVASK